MNKKELELDDAIELWNKYTENGTKNAHELDTIGILFQYYEIFPFETQMLYRYKH